MKVKIEGQKKSFIIKKSILLYAIIINLAGTQCMSMAGGIRSLFSRYTPTGSTVLQTVKKASIALANKTCNHKTLTALSLVSAAIVTPQARRAVSGGINSALNTGFFITAGIGPRSIVEIFLKAGVNVNQQHNRGWTALHNAVVVGNRAVVELLLVHKANPNITNNDGITALQAAVLGGHKAVVELLLSYGVNPNIVDENGITALQTAILWGHQAVVE